MSLGGTIPLLSSSSEMESAQEAASRILQVKTNKKVPRNEFFDYQISWCTWVEFIIMIPRLSSSSSSSSSPSPSYPEHRPSTINFHRFRFGATLSNLIQPCPSFFISDSTLLLHVFLGLPRRHLPGGFHVNACLVMWSFCFRSVCPIQVHFLLPISLPTGSWFVIFHRSSLLIFSGHHILTVTKYKF